MNSEIRRQELRKKLRDRIGEKQIKRSNKENKEKVLTQTLESMGIDKERFKKDLEALQKSGGSFTL
jgi:predicted DsbA family dithiol-disulfide isomerase